MRRPPSPPIFHLARHGWLLLWLLVACQQVEMPATPPLPATHEAACCPTATPPPTPEIVVLYPQPVNGYLPNPGIGWQNTRSLPDRFAETVRYSRFNWDELQPAPDVFDWTPIEALRQEAVAAGGQFHFRVRTTQPPPWGPGPTIPDWLLAQGAGVVDTERGPETQYSGCLFLREHGKFIDALRQQYDGDPDLAYLDIGSYGYYGEWGTPQYDDTPESLDWHIRRHIADMYLGGSATRPCQETDGSLGRISYNYVGFQRTRLLMPYNPWHEEALFYALSTRADVGIRFDALGSETHQRRFREKISDAVAQRWPTAPIVFELGAEAYTPEALASARAFAQEMHASLVHDNLGGKGSDADIAALLAVLGYRLQLLRAEFAASAVAGTEITVTMAWKNNGVAPPYTDFLLALALTDANGALLHQQITAVGTQTDINARGWLPGEIIQATAGITIPPDWPPGSYDLRLAFVHPLTQMPALTPANAGVDNQGRIRLGLITIK